MGKQDDPPQGSQNLKIFEKILAPIQAKAFKKKSLHLHPYQEGGCNQGVGDGKAVGREGGGNA